MRRRFPFHLVLSRRTGSSWPCSWVSHELLDDHVVAFLLLPQNQHLVLHAIEGDIQFLSPLQLQFLAFDDLLQFVESVVVVLVQRTQYLDLLLEVVVVGLQQMVQGRDLVLKVGHPCEVTFDVSAALPLFFPIPLLDWIVPLLQLLETDDSVHVAEVLLQKLLLLGLELLSIGFIVF